MYFLVCIYIRTTKTNYFEKDIFRLTPALLPPPVKLKELEPTKKNLFVLSKITNNWLGKKGTIGCLLFPFFFFMCSVSYIVQNRMLNALIH